MFKSNKLWVDKENNRFRIVNKFLGLKFGEWQKLPVRNFVGITKVKFSKTVGSPKLFGNNSCTSNFSDYKFCVFVCEDTRKKKMVFKGDYEVAMELAKQVAEYLELEITDFTS